MASGNENGENVDELREIFDLYDINRDGIISVKDMLSVMENLGLMTPTYQELQEAMQAEKTTDENITFADFVKLMSTRAGPTLEDEMRETFSMFDREGRGGITSSDIRQVLLAFGENLADDEIDRMIEAADRDGDGVVTFEDFLKLMSNN